MDGLGLVETLFSAGATKACAGVKLRLIVLCLGCGCSALQLHRDWVGRGRNEGWDVV